MKSSLDTIAFFKNIRETIDALNDEDAGAVFKALLAHDDGEEADLSGASQIVKAVFPLLAESTDRLNDYRSQKSKAGRTPKKHNRNTMESNEEQNGNITETHNHNHNHNQDHTSPDGEEKIRELKLPREADLPDGLDQEFVQEAWTAFREMRRKMKKPLTPRGEELLIKDLAKLAKGDPIRAEAIIDQSIKRGWQGLFDLKEKPAAATASIKEVYDAL